MFDSAIISIKATNIVTMIEINNIIAPIELTAAPTFSFADNITPNMNRRNGTMAYAIPTMNVRIPFRNIPLMSENSGSSFLPSMEYFIIS